MDISDDCDLGINTASCSRWIDVCVYLPPPPMELLRKGRAKARKFLHLCGRGRSLESDVQRPERYLDPVVIDLISRLILSICSPPLAMNDNHQSNSFKNVNLVSCQSLPASLHDTTQRTQTNQAKAGHSERIEWVLSSIWVVF